MRVVAMIAVAMIIIVGCWIDEPTRQLMEETSPLLSLSPLQRTIPAPVARYSLYLPTVAGGADAQTVQDSSLRRSRHGFGVRDAGDYDGDVIWFNWHHNRCHHASYWPMVYSKSKGSLDVPTNCAGKPLLLLNEPELRGQANTTPERAAEIIHQFRDWQGPLYCCGNYYAQLPNGDYYLHPQGINYMWAVIREYERRYNTAPPLDGVHLHIYNLSPTHYATVLVEVETLRLWRQMADRYKWQIVVSEMGAMPHGEGIERVIETMPKLFNIIETELRPDYIFWFAYEMPEVHHQGAVWHYLSLYENGELTKVGQEWQRITKSHGNAIRSLSIDPEYY